MEDISSVPSDIGPWIHSRFGFVVGKDGKGGSATRIELQDGSEALLTARHVVIDCILTGTMTVGGVGHKETIIPKQIRIASRTDAAFIVPATPTPGAPKVPFADWTTAEPDLEAGQIAFPSGFPGAWKQVDPKNKAITSMIACILGTRLSDPPRRGNLIICDIDETEQGLPSTFEGMSGGPLFSSGKKFLGVIVQEDRRKGGTTRGEIQAAPVEELEELHRPFKAPLNDYTGQKAWAPRLRLVNLQDHSRKAQLEVHADMAWSEKQRESQYGRIGRIQQLRFLTPTGAAQYPINTESVFYPQGDTDEERRKALDEELRFLLNRTGWGIEGPTL